MKNLLRIFTVLVFFPASVSTLSAQNKNSVQGDFEALRALYNATQGQGVPTVNSVNELPSDPRVAEYPYMYMIDGEIYYLEYDRHNEFVDGYSDGWKNAGSPWKNKSGWVNMTPETMGNAVGITTDGNGRVIRVDMQKVTTELVNGVYLTRGNGLVGELPKEIGNLTRLKYWNVKQNFLYGEIPSSIGNWTDVERLSFAGLSWDMQIDDDNRHQWHEDDHRKGYREINIVNGLAVGSGRLADIGKKIVATNRFRTDVPSSINGFQKLELIEIRHQFLTGILPEWNDMPSIRAILLDNARYAGAETISGTIPDSWGNLTTTVVFKLINYHTNPRYTGNLPQSLNNWANLANFDVSHNNFTGPILEFPLSRDKRYIRFIDNNFTGGFPSAYFDGDNSQMTKWQIGKNNLTGELPETISKPVYPSERENYAIDSPGIGDNNFTGPLPEWYQTMLGIQTFYIAGMSFSGPFPDKLMDQNNLKTFYIRDNNFSGELPDKNWGDKRISQFHIDGNNFEGSIPERWRSLILTDSKEFEWSSKVVELEKIGFEKFTGTSIALKWKPISGAMGYRVTLLDADAKKAYENEYVTDTELTITGLPLGEYRPIITGVSWTNPKSFTGTSATLTWDAVPGAAGYQVEIYDGSSNLVVRESWMNDERLTVSNLEPGTYTWRVRGMDYVANMGAANFSNNNLSGPIPEFFSEIEIGSLSLDGNRYTFRDIGPVYQAFLNANFTNFDIGNQKPFGKLQNRTMPSGETVVFDLSEFDYQGNSYQWVKDGTPIEGETNSVLTISNLSSENEGSYVLEVRNSDMPELGTHTSQPINFRIGEDDGLNGRNFSDDGSVGSKNGDDDGGGSSDGGTDNGLGGGTQPFPSAPDLYGPEDDSDYVSLTPEFVWSDIGADYYILQGSRLEPSGMSIDVIVKDTTFTADEILDDSTVHNWRVRGVKDGEQGEWSDIQWFTTMEENLPDVADLMAPVHTAQNIDPKTELLWEDVGADSYEIRILEKKTSDILFSDAIPNTSYVPNEVLPDTTDVVWQVRSIAAGVYGAWGPRWEFSTGIYRNDTPTLISPEQDSTYSNLIPTFEWESVDADRYVIIITRVDPTSAKSLTVIQEETKGTVYTPEKSLQPEMQYYWRVQAIKDGEEGVWSELWEFTLTNSIAQKAFGNQSNEEKLQQPLETSLTQNYPNPFNPTTRIEFALSEAQKVSLKVYDMAGRQVAMLVDDVLQAGHHSARFDASHLSSGIYIYQFISDTHQFSRKMTLIK